MNSFKTPKGTELPLMNLKGKDYLQVAHRLVWFREVNPDWAITTEVKDGYFRAAISTKEGLVLATAHKTIGQKPFALELAETGAVGRALAYVGFGTQFCGDELDEKEDLSDAPLERPKEESKKESNTPLNSTSQASVTIPSAEQTGDLRKAIRESEWSKEEVLSYVTKYIDKEAKKDSFKLEQLTGLQTLSMTRTVKAMPKKMGIGH